MTIKQQGGIFGRNPTFNDVEANTLGVNTTASYALDVNSGTDDTVARLLSTDTGASLRIEDSSGYSLVEYLNGKLNIYADQGDTGSNTRIRFYIDAAEVGRWDENANLKIMNGNLILGTSGNGIDFSATSGTGTSELFDDYEEGTFTPAFAGSSTAGSFTYTTQNGVYTKIGNIVIASSHVKVASVTTPAAGFLRLTGGPFTSNGSTVSSSAITATIAFTNSYVSAKMRSSGSTEVIFYDVGTGGITTLDASLIVANSEIQVTAIYYTG